MKKIIAFVALAVLVSSCGNKMTLMKRHYTKGFYFHHSDKVKQQDEASAERMKAEKMPTIKMYVSEQKKDLAVLASVSSSATETSAKHSLQGNLAKKVNEGHSVHARTISFVLKQKTNVLKEMDARKSGGGDANLLVMVILALFPFINLIAIYLHDGKAVTTNFWVCLILDILFFLPGIIFALLVVLDVVNLG